MGDRVKGKVALVMGAGSIGPGIGNGKAAAILYAREGAQVMAVDYNIKAAEETKGLIEKEGGKCSVFKADVCKSSDCKAVVEKCMKTFGRIDILHNNVGFGKPARVVETSEEVWDSTIDTNLKSVYLMCRYAIPYMVKQGGGAIVNISSIASIRYLNYPHAAYAASKGGVDALTREIAMEYASNGIRANAILPGFMNTPLISVALKDSYREKDEMIKKRNAMCPTGKMGDGWDVGYAALFLASDEAKYITGQTLVVDGGLTVKI
jgi:NAD(P)-dependent dehydrogenase (short-subunit alcohol dehydrogenase family)